MSDAILYNAQGEIIEKSVTGDLDPTFLKSFSQLMGSMSDADKIAMNPYELYSWVYANVNVLTRNIKTLTPILWPEGETDKIIYEHPALERLKRPNPLMRRSDFFEAIIMYLSLPTTATPGGQAFILPTDLQYQPVDLVKGIIPDYLWVASDEHVKPEVRNGHLIYWVYSPNNTADEIKFLPSQVIRIRNFNKNDSLLGLSPYSALMMSVTTDLKSRELQDKFFTNNASIGNILSSTGRLDVKQVDAIKSQIREKFSGPQRAGNLLALHSGMKLDQMETKNLTELQFIEGKDFTLTEVIACYATNKMELGMIEDVNRSTAEVMKELLWDDNLIPLINKLWDGGLNPDWISYLDKRNLVGGFDLSKVAALRRNTEGKIKSARLLIQDGVPPATAYETVGLIINIANMPWLEEPLVKGARVNLRTGEVVGGTVQEEPEEKEEKEEKTFVHKSMDREERDAFWVDYIKQTQAKPEKSYTRMIVKFWTGQRNRFLDQADTVGKSQKMITKAAVSDYMIPKGPEDKLLIAESEPIFIEGITLQTIKMDTELGELVNWDNTAAQQNVIIKSRNKFLKGINSTTFRTMGNEIETILLENPGLTNPELTKLIKASEKASFDRIISSHAKTVARTETSSIASKTRNEIMKEEKIKKHEWVTAKDERVRPLHTADDGKIVEIGKKFPNTRLKYPLETGGAPGNVINCRCLTVAVKS